MFFYVLLIFALLQILTGKHQSETDLGLWRVFRFDKCITTVLLCKCLDTNTEEFLLMDVNTCFPRACFEILWACITTLPAASFFETPGGMFFGPSWFFVQTLRNCRRERHHKASKQPL